MIFVKSAESIHFGLRSNIRTYILSFALLILIYGQINEITSNQRD